MGLLLLGHTMDRLHLTGEMTLELSLPKIPSLFIDKHLRTIANSPRTMTNDTISPIRVVVSAFRQRAAKQSFAVISY
jgi:hypothetical protein